MEHDIILGCLGEYHVPWVDQSLYSPHRKSSIVYCPYRERHAIGLSMCTDTTLCTEKENVIK
jgi:hypothetical protein